MKATNKKLQGGLIMQSDAQVLSQLLWDLRDSKRNQHETLDSFFKSLMLENTDTHAPALQPMREALEKPLKCVLDNKKDMAIDYLKLCNEVHNWPYDAFLAALIDIMEDNSPWSKNWKYIDAKHRQKKAQFLDANGSNAEKLYADSIVMELRPAVDGRKKTITEYYKIRWQREDLIKKTHYFVNLKGMSSSSPIIYNNTFGTSLRGGGFYFCWNRFGVVVDPGLYFVTNMHEHGLSIHDIDAVVVTHDHIDHTGDIQLLDDLEYQIKGKKTIQWYVCQEIYDAGRLEKNNMHLVKYGETHTLSQLVSFYATETRHIKATSTPSGYLLTTFGCVFTLKAHNLPSGAQIEERVMGYTSDTIYWDGMEKDYDNTDILIANISSVRKEDLLLEQQHKLHLGFGGCMNMLLNFTQAPGLFLLSEFWNGIEDIRFSVSKQLRRAVLQKGLDTAVLPTEIGMEIDLTNMGVKCSCCGAYAKGISLVRPRCEFGEMGYVCEECLITSDKR